ncbi:Neurogenic locus Notch protein, partial [Habropoda laboriosa]
CTPKYVGEYCQHLNPCHTGPRCQNGGSCRVKESIGGGTPSFACSCPVGFSASLCEIPIENACDSSPCLNGATCNLKSLHEYVCTCATGYTGEHCERQDHCASSPCRNGAECLSLEDSYKCTCAPGFTGPNCADDIDECDRNPCRHGSCKNIHGSYKCMCSSGYTGQNCENEYIPCDPSPCKNGGTCRQIDNLEYECSCPEGQGSSLSRDRVSISFIVCLSSSRSLLLNRAIYAGARKAIYVGEIQITARFRGEHCEENIDDCPGNLCQNGATCKDRINEYSCLCPPSYTGTQCELDVDECSVRPSLCHNGATCTNSPGSYSCICVSGWTGPDCSVNIDDCAGAACFNGATCIDRVGSFYCQCTYGKTGLLCHLDDACTSNPCHEGAICDTSPINGSFTCSCATGYKGVDCSEDIDECEQGSPCEHDGICVNTPGSFACNCTQGFTGPRCETNVNECESHPCQNDGSCLDDPGTFRCVCMPGKLTRIFTPPYISSSRWPA